MAKRKNKTYYTIPDYLPCFRAGDRVLYARNRGGKAPVTGGTPISEDTALMLRTVVFGTAVAPPRSEWTRTGLGPREYGDYRLKGTRNSTRGLMTVLQAELVKFLLFDKSNPKGEPPDRLLNVGLSRLQEGIIQALCKIIWRIGERTSAVLCLPQEKTYLYQSMDYYQDGITEKLHTFEITNYDDLEIMVKRYSHLFLEEAGPGALLLIYTCVMTRGANKILKDMDGSRPMLVGIEDEGSLCIVTLLLTGRATPYLHNGVIYVGDEDHYAVPRFGILSRSEIGLLVHTDIPTDEESNLPGSRLKTPSLPVWVIFSSGHFAILFNTNKELLHNYHAERRFDLTYLSCGGSSYQLTVDTRQSPYVTTNSHPDDLQLSNVSGIEKVIQEKWPDAHITWHNPNTK